MYNVASKGNVAPIHGMPLTPKQQDWDVFDAAPKETRDFLNYAPTKLTVTEPLTIPFGQVVNYYALHHENTLRLYGPDYPDNFTILDDPLQTRGAR